MGLTNDEQRVCDAIAARADELTALASELIAFDTTGWPGISRTSSGELTR